MTAASFDRLQLLRAARLSSPGILGWRLRRRYRFALRRMGTCRGARVLDVGGGYGTFGSILVRAGAAEVIVVEPQLERVETGRQLHRRRRALRFEHADVLDRLDLLAGIDTVSALHSLHQLGPRVHELFEAIARSPVVRVVLQGGVSHADRVNPAQEAGLYGSVLGLPGGLARLLERHGFQPTIHEHRRYPVVMGVRA